MKQIKKIQIKEIQIKENYHLRDLKLQTDSNDSGNLGAACTHTRRRVRRRQSLSSLQATHETFAETKDTGCDGDDTS